MSRTKVQNENEDTRNQCKIRWSNESMSGVMSGNVSDKSPLELAVCEKQASRGPLR